MEHLPFRIAGPFIVLAIVTYVALSQRRKQRRYATARERYIAAGDAIPPYLDTPRRWPWTRGLIGAIALPSLYLILFRGISLLPPFIWDHKGGAILMSFSFLFLGPFVAGFITVSRGAEQEPWAVSQWIIAPWIPLAINLVLALSFLWEGLICVVFIAPPAMLSASLGGVAAGALHRYLHRRVSGTPLLCIATLPLLLAVLETQANQPLQTRTVQTSILIHASAPVVWSNIQRVPAIAHSELHSSWANDIGFPRPVEATLSHEGVGGVRSASFERGLNFTETITNWQPGRRIGFTIQANTASIPSTTLDEHVTVGGRFFDVLTGEYTLEPRPNGNILLHLSSQERLTTDFNLYAALWSDAVMSDMQNNILGVIKHRCEAISTQRAVLQPLH